MIPRYPDLPGDIWFTVPWCAFNLVVMPTVAAVCLWQAFFPAPVVCDRCGLREEVKSVTLPRLRTKLCRDCRSLPEVKEAEARWKEWHLRTYGR